MNRYLILPLLLLPWIAQASQPTGQWKLTQLVSEGYTLNCPGKIPLPPSAPAVQQAAMQCGSNETLNIMSNGRYQSSLSAMIANMDTMTGYWFAKQWSNFGSFINFISPMYPNRPRAYTYVLSNRNRNLTVSDEMTVYDTATKAYRVIKASMVFEKIGR